MDAFTLITTGYNLLAFFCLVLTFYAFIKAYISMKLEQKNKEDSLTVTVGSFFISNKETYKIVSIHISEGLEREQITIGYTQDYEEIFYSELSKLKEDKIEILN